MKKSLVPLLITLVCGAVLAKIPAPILSDEAKAKAAEAAAKTAWSAKVENYLLCKYQEKAAANYVKTAAANGKTAKPAAPTPACVDAGAFVYAPAAGAVPAAGPVAAPAPASPAKKS